MRSNSIQASKLPMATGNSRKGMCSPESGKEVWTSQGSRAGARRWGGAWDIHTFCQGFYRRGRNMGGRTAASGWAGRRPRHWAHGHVQLCEVHSGQELTELPALSRAASCSHLGHFPSTGSWRDGFHAGHCCCYMLRQGPHFFGFQNKPK